MSHSARRIEKILKKKSTSTLSTSNKRHDYQQRKSLAIPSSISPKGKHVSKRSFGKAQVILQKTPKSTLEQMHCTPNQKYPLFLLEAFQQRKIENIHFKELLIATRNLKQLSHEMQRWMHAHCHQEIKVIKDEPIEFYDLLERREERHFRIDRIIRYLSDI